MRLVLGIGLALAMTSPVSAQRVKLVPPPPLAAKPAPPATQVRPVSLTRLAANIAPGTPWAAENTSPYYMVPCVGEGDVSVWQESYNKISSLDAFDRIFRDELAAAGLQISGDPTNLFEERASADLQVGALITDLKLKLCRYVTVLSDSYQGAATMDVEWQVYSVSQARVVARIRTRGGGDIKGVRDEDADAVLMRAAFADNARRLAVDEEFLKAIAVGAPAATPPPLAAIRFTPPKETATPLDVAVRSVVTIYAGEGAGSGVLISSDGLILTNHHVAGDTGPLRIRWSDGTDSIGEVVRSDPRRDVALIRTAPRAAPLPIRAAPARLGETVFAIGTPLRKEFANTLTRGVVSATRLVEGQTVIQSDVAVDRGNSGGPLLDEQGRILALTVSGYVEDGVGRNINFFIPIQDALRVLALQPAS